jgi:mannose-6-phosphate isomerase-like protein (cupin superfamily)
MSIVSKANAPHYAWGGNCDGWRLVQQDSLSVIEERMPAGASEVPHHHERARQFFYVLTGKLGMEIEGVLQEIPAGHGLEIAPGTRHRACNPGADPVTFILVSTPPTAGDRINAT